jgi:hypothetical protein
MSRILVVATLAALVAGCASLPPPEGRTATTALADTSGTRLGRAVAADVAANPGKTGIHALPEGHAAFAARVLLASAAEKSIDAQYYIWHGDQVGYLLFEALCVTTPSRERPGSGAGASRCYRSSRSIGCSSPAHGPTALMKRLLLLLLPVLFAAAGNAASLPPAAKAEIDALLSRLEASSCTFNRNGTWYPATEAKTHLLRKLKYLENKGAVQSTEQFIELAASSSSTTGQPYLVKCGSGAPVQSGAWLRSQLQGVRSPGREKSPP